MEADISYDEYKELLEKIKFYDVMYIKGDPVISDQEYDDFVRKIMKIEELHPNWSDEKSPTVSLDHQLFDSNKDIVRHAYPMLSLQNVYNYQETQAYFDRAESTTSLKDLIFTLEYKIDGIAINIVYEDRKLLLVSTRGDGVSGEDITENMQQIIPSSMPSSFPLGRVEIRGEAYIDKETFRSLNNQRSSEGKALWGNPRNLVAGSVRLLDSNEFRTRGVKLFCYTICTPLSTEFKRQSDLVAYLNKWEFIANPILFKGSRFDFSEELFNSIEQNRLNLPFDVDGLVIKIDEFWIRDIMGSSGKFPRWGVAYKFLAEKKETTIREIICQVSRRGLLTPVAILEPVPFSGVCIKRASLHNFNEIARQDIRVGDQVYIERRGDVIPQVVEVLFNKRSSPLKKWLPPSCCPTCLSSLIREVTEKGDYFLYCSNFNCSAQKRGRIVHFAGPSGMDIKGLGEELIIKLIDVSLVSMPHHIYSLQMNDLIAIDGIQKKLANKIIKSIFTSRETRLSKLLSALSIPHVGVVLANNIAAHVKSIETLLTITKDELMSIDGVGERIANVVCQTIHNEAFQQEINKLNSVLHLKEEAISTGKSVVITGALSISRGKFQAKLKENNFHIQNQINKKTDLLIIGESPGSKVEQAKRMGIPIYTEEAFNELFFK